jgi:transposase-like protein
MTHHPLTSRRLVDTVDMEENKKKETKVRRKFDREFKNDAVRLVELSNRSVKQVAKELDILRSHPVQLDV